MQDVLLRRLLAAWGFGRRGLEGLIILLGAVAWFVGTVLSWVWGLGCSALLIGFRFIVDVVDLRGAWCRECKQSLLCRVGVASDLVGGSPLLGLAGRVSVGGGLYDGL